MTEPRIVTSATLNDLFDDLASMLIYARPSDLDYQSSIDCHIYDVVGVAESMEWSYDLKVQWLTKGRWGTLVRQYLDPEDVNAWLELCKELTPKKDRGVAALRTKTVKKRMHGTRASRRFGSCMLAISYRAIPVPQITLHSRASYLGYLGPLDLTVAYNAAKYVGALHGLEPGDFKFVWNVEALQWPNYKSLGYMLRQKNLFKVLTQASPLLMPSEKRLIQMHPTIHHSRKWMRRFLDQDKRDLTYGEAEKYGAVRRIRQRYHAEFRPGLGDRFTDSDAKALPALPSVELADLDFSPIGVLLP